MSLFKSLDSLPSGGESPARAIPKFTSIEYTTETFLSKLKDMNNISDREIQDIIFRQHHIFLDYDLFLDNPKSRQIAQDMFTNERFLSNLVMCVVQMNLTEHQIICCNKLAYDYIAYHTMTDINPTVRHLLMELCYRINLKTVLTLAPIVGVDSAKYIALFRKSSFKEDVNISRVNRYLIKSGLEIKEQNILDIYGKLFERVSNLFIVTMLEMPESDFSPLEKFRYDEMSKSMIDMLDNMPSTEIRKVLENYATVYSLKGEPPIRFSMKYLHESYSRIKQVIYQLNEDGIKVP